VIRILHGDCRDVLRTLPDASVQCCVSSPPYYGLRDYGVAGQIGLEASPDEYVAEMVGVFREVRRVLRDDGTLWLNIGDSYASSQSNNGGCSPRSTLSGGGGRYRDGSKNEAQYDNRTSRRLDHGAKPKDLLGIPWMLAFALRADGWWLRSDIIWAKLNPMPESVGDRPTSAHEHVFLLTKRSTYFYDSKAIEEEASPSSFERWKGGTSRVNASAQGMNVALGKGANSCGVREDGTRNARNVWTIASHPFSGSHFATMPPDLAERCIKAGSKPGDTILDPFSGAGTTALVAARLQRHAIGIELNPEYAAMGAERVRDDAPLFAAVS
jgi:DNA modification methylase